MKLVQLGQTGQLGRELTERANNEGIALVSLSRKDLDLSQPGCVSKVLARLEAFDALIISAAYTAVDKAEDEEDLALAVNAGSVAAAAEFCAKHGIPVIHISTDYVFDGRKVGAYSPSDAVGPVGAYGRTKLAGELALAQLQPEHVILRTAWVYSSYGNNFVKTMLRVGAGRDELRVVADQRGCPTAAGDLADAILNVAVKCVSNPTPECWGVFHYGGDGDTSWYEFACAIFEQSSPWMKTAPKVVPIPTSEYPTRAQRPKNSTLDCSKLREIYSIKTKSWHTALEETLAKLSSLDNGKIK
jgi:dTDP-4-dehydrorhamnose reductase